MKFFALLVVTISLLTSACGPKKPSYGDIATDKEGRAVAQNSNQQAPTPTEQAASQPQQPSAGQTQPAATQPAQFKVPEFFDITTGQIKDLPSYPRASRISVQYGPLQETQSAMLVLQTSDPFDRIAAFYDRAIKTGGWKIVSDQRDQDVMKIEMQKGERDEGLVRVFRDENTKLMMISISRIEKAAQPKQ